MKTNKEQNLSEAIIAIGNNPTLMEAFLTDILTPSEYVEIKKRWEIVKMLDAGVNQHKIAKKLHVGIATVTRGARTIKDSKGGFTKMLEKNHLN